MRPFLLAAGLALMWFALFQDTEIGANLPVWGMAALIGSRLLADLVVAWLGLTVVRLAVALAQLGWVQLRTPRNPRG